VLYIVVPKGFFPEQDTGFVLASEARQDISFEAMSKITTGSPKLLVKTRGPSGVAFAGATAATPAKTRTDDDSIEGFQGSRCVGSASHQRLSRKLHRFKERNSICRLLRT